MTHVDPMQGKPFSPSCERNRDPILAVLREQLADRHRVLEIGSGTGQHAAHFAAAMPWLTWQCSDVADNLPGIRAWLDEAVLPNTPAPIELDVSQVTSFERLGAANDPFDAVFSANTLHIMGWAEVEAFFAGVDHLLKGALHPPSSSFSAGARAAGQVSGLLAVYGPFKHDGDYSSDSNREFDTLLKARDPRSGIRDLEAVDALARAIGLQLRDDMAMPANNRCVVWQRV